MLTTVNLAAVFVSSLSLSPSFSSSRSHRYRVSSYKNPQRAFARLHVELQNAYLATSRSSTRPDDISRRSFPNRRSCVVSETGSRALNRKENRRKGLRVYAPIDQRESPRRRWWWIRCARRRVLSRRKTVSRTKRISNLPPRLPPTHRPAVVVPTRPRSPGAAPSSSSPSSPPSPVALRVYTRIYSLHWRRRRRRRRWRQVAALRSLFNSLVLASHPVYRARSPTPARHSAVEKRGEPASLFRGPRAAR